MGRGDLALHGGGVEFVIIGGPASVLHGSAYVTADFDLSYSRANENVQRLITVLTPLHPRLRHASKNVSLFMRVRADQAQISNLATDIGEFDLFGELTALVD
jgi:hypothetical protein